MGRTKGALNKPKVQGEEPIVIGPTSERGRTRPVDEIQISQASSGPQGQERAESVPARDCHIWDERELHPEEVAAAREYLSDRTGREVCRENVRHLHGLWNPLLRARITVGTERLYRAGVERFIT